MKAFHAAPAIITALVLPLAMGLLGPTADAAPPEGTGSPVCIEIPGNAMCIDAFQETNEGFAAFLNEHGNSCSGHLCMDSKNTRIRRVDGVLRAVKEYERHPVAWVTWYGASAACKAKGARLCTGQEWEAACKGPDGTHFPYGKTFVKDRCNGFEAGIGKTVPVGSKKQCEGGLSGLFDMNGNVWDWLGSCRRGKCEIRGGSFQTYFSYMACIYWDRYKPAHAEEYIGFRCCRDR